MAEGHCQVNASLVTFCTFHLNGARKERAKKVTVVVDFDTQRMTSSEEEQRAILAAKFSGSQILRCWGQ